MVNISTGKYILVSSLTLLVGMGVVGIPLFIQSKGYHEETEVLNKKLETVTFQYDQLSQESSFVSNDINRVKRNYNRLLDIIEKHDGKLPSGWGYETCTDILKTEPKCI